MTSWPAPRTLEFDREREWRVASRMRDAEIGDPRGFRPKLDDLFGSTGIGEAPQCRASATASAPAGNRSCPESSVAARHTTSATSDSVVTAAGRP